ncbi:MAG: hypothetical protein Ct9H300mP1_17180 [Planctomycetaceae bacterium]|nr:MAG: hypothetical protein Ct9H300mP1_17180 [Planctomycetaceae bacterium]
MGAEQKALELGLTFPDQEPGYLNLCARAGTCCSVRDTPAT